MNESVTPLVRSPGLDYRRELMYKCQRILQIVRRTDWKMQLLGFWEFLKLFVRDSYADVAIVEFC